MTIPVTVNKSYKIDIIDMSSEGKGVGKIEGFTVFVDGALSGETVEARIYDVSKSYAKAIAINIISASPYRIDPQCTVIGCGGCQLMHMSYEGQLLYKKRKVENDLRHIGKLDVKVNDIIGAKNPWHYRNKAEFAVSIDENGNPLVGFKMAKSHKVIPVESCLIQNEKTGEIISAFKKAIEEIRNDINKKYNNSKKRPGGEQTFNGIGIERIVTKVSGMNGNIMIVLETTGEHVTYINNITDVLSKVQGIVSIVQAYKTNGHIKTRVLYGENKIIDKIGDLRFYITPLSFFQVNPEQTVKLYDKALQYASLTGHERVIDAYCGIGTISLYLARKAKEVYGIEVVNEAVTAAKDNAVLNEISNVHFIAGKAEEEIACLYKSGYKANVVVVDPPRKGCDPKLLKTLAEMRPDTVVYVSCDPATLARDLHYLGNNGYDIIEVQPVDMFTGTYHVECVTLMSRV